ncbi:hypothetical protein ACEWY4_000110 [Coilia grayii]|uniref:Cortactin-binding protein-2 N-terminal domain-containing protein n=1 Tax=Coilia grayii TaxID=363190 RepID=A0ABD1KVS1_9TELE
MSQHRDAVVQMRYGQYDLSDPFMCSQHRDAVVQMRYGQYDLSDPLHGAAAGQRGAGRGPAGRGGCRRRRMKGAGQPSGGPELLLAHCRRMQDKMKAQLTAAEIRHRRVISDLRRRGGVMLRMLAEGDDVTYMLEKERQRLLQQLECERARQQQLEQECERAITQAREECERAASLESRLQEESSTAEACRGAGGAEEPRAAPGGLGREAAGRV